MTIPINYELAIKVLLANDWQPSGMTETQFTEYVYQILNIKVSLGYVRKLRLQMQLPINLRGQLPAIHWKPRKPVNANELVNKTITELKELNLKEEQ